MGRNNPKKAQNYHRPCKKPVTILENSHIDLSQNEECDEQLQQTV